jgi:hypothetical protein
MDDRNLDDQAVAGPPCPFCGGHAFTCDAAELPPDNWLAAEFAETHYQARACAECGNVQIVLTTRYADAAAV